MLVTVAVNANKNIKTPKITLSLEPKNHTTHIRLDVTHNLEVLGLIDMLANTWQLKTSVNEVRITESGGVLSDTIRAAIRAIFIEAPDEEILESPMEEPSAVLSTEENIKKLVYNMSRNHTTPNQYSRKEAIINYVRNLFPGRYSDDECYAFYQTGKKRMTK